MKNIELILFDAPDELARAVAGAWLEEVAAAQRAGKPHCVALSGGRITQKFFAEVAVLSKARGVSLAGVHFFWADERCVPPSDAESNFKMADELLFQPLGIAPEKIHRIHGELPPAAAAELAVKDFSAVTAQLDLVLLGMGEDGHVASLFPGEPEADRTNPAVFRAITNSPKPPPNRVTLGYAAIAAAKQVWVLASGAGKEAALRESLSPAGQTPLARVLRARSNSKVFTDIRL
ncbi:MAG: 6-phosphogluconolactonase [Verrucomicrobia bacterium]|nr:6-phosphogluconolactonase [Verrucomicrobiota bacterium]